MSRIFTIAAAACLICASFGAQASECAQPIYQALKPARRDALLAIPLFLGTWAAVWWAGWLAGVYFFAGSDLPAFIGGYLGCLSAAVVTHQAMRRLRP